jgi:transcriptional regulator with XRE-family HTH domain
MPAIADHPAAHPAVGILAIRRITRRQVARELGFSEHYVGRALNGVERPSPRFRAALARLLALPETELFHIGVLR